MAWLTQIVYIVCVQRYSQNGATLMQSDRGDKITKKYKKFSLQKVFSSLHNIQIEPLMADGVLLTMSFILFWTLMLLFTRQSMGQSQGSRFSSKISSSFKFQVLFVRYTTIQRLYNKQ